MYGMDQSIVMVLLWYGSKYGMDQGINVLVWYWYCVGMDQGGYSDHTPWTLSSAGMQQISTSLDRSSITLIPFKTIQPSSITSSDSS